MLRKTMFLATVVAVVLSAAATALAASPGDDKDSSKGTLGKNELGKNKDFAGLVDIGGGRKMYMECRGKGSPTVVLVSGFRGAYEDWTHLGDAGKKKSCALGFNNHGQCVRTLRHAGGDR